MKTFRKGAIVRYTGTDPIAIGMTFKVIQKTGSHITIMWPTRYISGEIHLSKASKPIKDFEIIA